MTDTTPNSAAGNMDSFFTNDQLPVQPPPPGTIGVVGWMRNNLFSSITNAILTFIGIYIIYLIVPPLIKFAFIDAVWVGKTREVCLDTAQGGVLPEGWSGACWAFVDAKWGQFIYGDYPVAERWRVNMFFVLLFGGIAWLVIEALPWRKWVAIAMLTIIPIISYYLLTGGMGMEIVETPLWGGLLVTLVVSVVGIVASLPLGILLALGRRSDMPFVKMVCVIFIEFWRGIPLITVLFMASVLLPLFLPEGTDFDKLLRVLIGVALFSSAYMAEVVRGGLQAIPKGQYEAADALGLNFSRKMGLIVLPQALKLVIPGIVNTFIGLFKDTTLVLIVGMFDLLGAVQSASTDPNWITPVTSTTGYLFAAFGFWIFCFGMSRYSIFMENKLHTGHKR